METMPEPSPKKMMKSQTSGGTARTVLMRTMVATRNAAKRELRPIMMGKPSTQPISSDSTVTSRVQGRPRRTSPNW